MKNLSRPWICFARLSLSTRFFGYIEAVCRLKLELLSPLALLSSLG